jgi:hypothetical protein
VDSIPPGFAPQGSGPEALFEHLLFTIGFDGLVTGQDRLARNWLDNRMASPRYEQNNIIERLIDRVEKSGSKPPYPMESDATR